MGRTTRFLRLIDLLVTPYDFNVNQNQKSLTATGGIITLLILLIMTLYSANYYFKSLNSNSSIYASTQTDQDANYNLDQSTALFVLEISKYPSGQVISFMEDLNSYISIEAQYINQTRIQDVQGYTRQYNSLQTINCPQQNIQSFNFQSNSFTTTQLENLICFQGNYSVSGQFYDSNFQYIKLMVRKCSGSSICKSKEEIAEFIESGINIDLFLKDSKIKKSLNITNPASEFATNVYWKLTTTVGNSEDIYLQPIMVDLVNNQAFSNIDNDGVQRIYQSSKVKRQERRQLPISMDTVDELCTFYIRLSSDSEYYFALQNNIFTLILQAISEGAGLAVAIFGVAKIIYKFYNDHKTFETIMNYVFKFDLTESQLNAIDLTPDHQCDSKKFHLDKLYSQKLQYSFFSFIWFKTVKFIKSQICWKYCGAKYDKNIVLSQMAKSKIQNDMDLGNIVKKLYEIDFIKLFLFDDDQLLLFNSFCYPVFQKKMIGQKAELKQLQFRTDNQVHSNISEFERATLKKKSSKLQITVNDAVKSDIPMEFRLAKLARFFKAQIKVTNGQELLQIYQKIKDNKNTNIIQNNNLLRFTQYNKSLYQLVEINDQVKILFNIFKKQRNSVKIAKSENAKLFHQPSQFRKDHENDLQSDKLSQPESEERVVEEELQQNSLKSLGS